MIFQWWGQIRDWAILAVLLLVSVTTMLTWNDPVAQRLRTLSLEVTSRIEARLTWAGQFVRAIDENKTLRRNNLALTSQLARLNVARVENEVLRDALRLKENDTHAVVAARIISKDIFDQNNHLTLDVGASDDVEVDMPVVNEQGILGRVVLVSSHYSRVLPYLNTGFRVPVEVLPSFAIGMVSWPGNRPDVLMLEGITKTASVSVGDTVVTSATSRIFPPGYPVGVITDVVTSPGMNSLDIRIQRSAMIDRTQYAFVLLHQHDEEREQLENTAAW